MKQLKFKRKICVVFIVSIATVFTLFFCFDSNIRAGNDDCGVGTSVQGNMGGGAKGKIAEIGTASPYVGWYRIVFDWNSPNGDWYNPKNWEIYIAGTNTRCGQEQAKQPQNNKDRNDLPLDKRDEPIPNETSECPMDAPSGKVSKTAKASESLFKRVIYEWEAAKINPESISAPKQIGLTFLKFEMGKAFKNTLTSSRFGDKRIHDGAPVGALIYPIKTKELQCELYDSSIKRWVTENVGNCFKNRSGEWTCPRRTTKTIENKLIPLK